MLLDNGRLIKIPPIILADGRVNLYKDLQGGTCRQDSSNNGVGDFREEQNGIPEP
jgi:hypothetical protein